MISLSMSEMLSRLLLALACGAIIGLNRDLHKKSAGFRTFGLVSVGSAIVALGITQMSPDPNAVSRVIQGVLTGIGFLGAGVILHQPTSSRVTGLTTAAAVWLTAGLGLACGLGQYSLAFAGLGVALVILIVGRPIERRVEKLFLPRHAAPPATAETPEDSDG
ncbi:MAG TPA: MgtC/SapB family protein [Steroidobacteraceae bacterium]|jgi:putative Mg2+ transporter-C (MgtC) family protein|nr:MgtC/SapB family protein [Steroidobacteraceae bacterium]